MLAVLIWSAVGVVVLIALYLWLSRLIKYDDDLSGDLYQQRWQQIEKYLGSRDEPAWRLAVIEADNFLDSLLKFKGIGGNGLGDRLKVAQAKFKDLRQVWPAHLLRNRLVHESDYKLSHGHAKSAVRSFLQAAKVLGFKKR